MKTKGHKDHRGDNKMERLCDFAADILSMIMLDVNYKAESSAFSFTREVTGSLQSKQEKLDH